METGTKEGEAEKTSPANGENSQTSATNPYIDPAYVAKLEAQLKDAQDREQQYATSVDQFSDVVKKAVDKALAERDNKAAETAKAEKEAQATVTETAKIKTATSVDSTGPLYGNRDFDKVFDLREMTSLQELPTDKTIIVLPTYTRDGLGNPTGYDPKNSRVQFIDPIAHDQRSATDKATGASTYKLLGVEPVVVHVPKQA